MVCRRSQIILIIVVASMVIGIPHDGRAEGNSKVNPDVAATGSFWTEERLSSRPTTAGVHRSGGGIGKWSG